MSEKSRNEEMLKYPANHHFRDKLYVAVEFYESLRVAVHMIQRPCYFEPGSYHRAISFDGFRRRTLDLWFGEKSDRRPKRWYKIDTGCHFIEDQCSSIFSRMIHGEDGKLIMGPDGRFAEKPPLDPKHVTALQAIAYDDSLKNLPIVNHADLYDFYAYIGWDRKRGKFVPLTNPTQPVDDTP